MKITLITVCYNSEKTIKDTLDSVLNQTYENYEYLIIDGKSKDDTVEIVKRYEKKFKGKIKIISESDKGLYDAMNKGIKKATGDIIGILNSDDILANKHVFEKIVNTFNEKKVDAVYSNLVFMEETLKIPVRNFIAHKPSKYFGWHPPHPTLYLRKNVYDEIGKFNLNYKICADFDFMMRIIKHDYKFAYIKEYFVIMRAGGISTDGLKGYIKNLKEANVVLRNNNIKFYHLINFFRIFKTFNQGISAKIFKNKILNRLREEEIYERENK